jgi:hypothetical protein
MPGCRETARARVATTIAERANLIYAPILKLKNFFTPPTIPPLYFTFFLS